MEFKKKDMKSDSAKQVSEIIYLLKVLKYELENWDSGWVYTVLVESSTSTCNLLIWILRQHVPSLISDLFASSKASDLMIARVMKELWSLGLCTVSEMKLFQGSANPSTILKFWLSILLKTILIRRVDECRDLDHVADPILEQIVHSSKLNFKEKDDKFSILPPDLRRYYNNWSKKDPSYLPCEVCEVEELLNEERKKSKEQEPECTSTDELCESLSKLTNTMNELDKSFASSFLPWFSDIKQDFDVAETGFAVEKAKCDLDKLQKFAKLSEDVEQYSLSTGIKADRLNTLRSSLPASNILNSLNIAESISGCHAVF